MPYLREAWYLAAWAEEIKPGELFHRTLLDEPVVFYRLRSGAIAALHDRCPHRFVPLHLGKLENDIIQCAYHGLQFDCSGKCVHNPHGSSKAAATRPYAVVERDGLVWIWMGESAEAKLELVPDFSHMSGLPETAGSQGYLWTECNYKLVADNVMDLSHADFLHADSVGGGAFTAARQHVEEMGDAVHITWECRHDKAPPIYDQFLAVPGQPVQFRTEVRWRAPGIMNLDITITPCGGGPLQALQTHNAHIVTPETATTTHYFFWLTRQFHMEDAQINAHRHTAMMRAFSTEDKPMLCEQQRAMGTDDLFSLRPVLLPSDAGAVRARRKLEQRIRDEQAAKASRPSIEAAQRPTTQTAT